MRDIKSNDFISCNYYIFNCNEWEYKFLSENDALSSGSSEITVHNIIKKDLFSSHTK